MFPVGDTVPRRNPPIATWLIIIANCVVFLFELSMPEDVLQHFLYLFGIVPARYTHPDWASALGFPIGSYWPFVTSMFLHGGWIHIIANMWTLWIFGDNVEDRMGPVRFVIFYLLCGVAAGVVHSLTNPDSTLPALGASGAIAGVMGAYLLLFPSARIIVVILLLIFPLFFEIPAVIYLGLWALSQLFSGTLALSQPGYAGGIAWWAHVGGFVSGMALHRLFLKRRGLYRRPSRDEYEMAGAWLPSNYWR